MSTSNQKRTTQYEMGDPRSFNPYDQHTNYQEKYILQHKESLDTSNFQAKQGQKDTSDLSEQEKVVIQDIQATHSQKLHNLNAFLNKHYALFTYKVHKCMYTHCYKDLQQDNNLIDKCNQKCQQGFNKVQLFVQNQVDQLKDSLVECIDQSQKPQKDLIHEHFICYQKFFKSIDTMKKNINVEFSFYE